MQVRGLTERQDWAALVPRRQESWELVLRLCRSWELWSLSIIPVLGGRADMGGNPSFLNSPAQPMSSRLQNTFVWWYMPAIPALVWVWRGQSSRSSLPTYMESSRSPSAMRLSQTNTRKFHINWAGLLEGQERTRRCHNQINGWKISRLAERYPFLD